MLSDKEDPSFMRPEAYQLVAEVVEGGSFKKKNEKARCESLYRM